LRDGISKADPWENLVIADAATAPPGAMRAGKAGPGNHNRSDGRSGGLHGPGGKGAWSEAHSGYGPP
jgi:hypothetical protein